MLLIRYTRLKHACFFGNIHLSTFFLRDRMSQQNKHRGINITSVLTHGQSEWRSLFNGINNRPDSRKIQMSPLSVSRNFTWNAIYFITTDRRALNSKLKKSKLDGTTKKKKKKKKMKTLNLTLWLWHADSELPLNQQPNMKAHV